MDHQDDIQPPTHTAASSPDAARASGETGETGEPEAVSTSDAVTEEPPADRPPRFADSYGLVLVLLIASYFVMAVAGDYHYGRMLSLVMLATTTWLALRASQVERRLLRYAVTFIPVTTLAAIVLSVVGSENLTRAISAALAALLVIVAPVAIVKRLATHLVVNMNTFYGAICVYLLIAMFFASLFALSGVLAGDSFFVQLQPPDKASTIDYLYFSFTTITTVGYGDLTAQGNVGRMLAVLEAVLGQLYLITVVSLVVQNLGQARRKKQPLD
ncbi:MAG: potassium channel family protein [Actinobacteria bacterium]|nr:potassium channel family protein [Actinomycetota bacterium]